MEENMEANQAAAIPLPNVIAVDDIEQSIDEVIEEPAENGNENQAALLPMLIGSAIVVDMAIAIKAEGDEEPVIDDENVDGIHQETEIEQVKLELIVNELSVEQMMELDDILVDDMTADPLDCSSGPDGSDSNGNTDFAIPGCSYVHPQLEMDRNAMASGNVDDSDDSDYEDAVGESKSNQIIWVTVDEDVLIEHKSSYPVQPLCDPDFELLKQEDDIISGNIQFRDEVCV